MKFRSGHIRKAQPGFFFIAANTAKIIIGGIIKHIALNDRAGGYDSYNISFNKPFNKLGILKLLANCHLIAAVYKLCDIRIRRMKRHTAHRRTLIHTAFLAGEHQIKLIGGGFGIVKNIS